MKLSEKLTIVIDKEGFLKSYKDHLPIDQIKKNQKNVNEVNLLKLNNIWKMSLPLLTLIAVFLALPLSKIKPRQGRYSKVLPCLIVFLVYLGLLLLIKSFLKVSKLLCIKNFDLLLINE